MLFEIILYVSNQEKSRNFYVETLGLKPSLDVPGMTEFQLAENLKLGLMPEMGIAKILGSKTPHPQSGNGIPRCELYLLNEQAEIYLSRSLQAGAKLISPFEKRDWGDKVAYVSDPDGHILAFASKI